VDLEGSSMAHVRTFAVSPNLEWVAFSGDSRGGVWSARTGQRVMLMRSFEGAYFAGDSLVAKFPAFEEAKPNIVSLSLTTRGPEGAKEIPEDESIRQAGPYLIVTKRNMKKDEGIFVFNPFDLDLDDLIQRLEEIVLGRNVNLEVRDISSGKTLWSREFTKGAPRIFANPVDKVGVFTWSLKSDAAKEVIKANPDLGPKVAAMKEKQGDYLLQVVNLTDGSILGHILVETGKGSYRIEDVTAAGDRVIVADDANRLLVYSLVSGKVVGRLFGDQPHISLKKSVLATRNNRDHLVTYNLENLEKIDDFVFKAPVAAYSFAPDGRAVTVLTAEEEVYLLSLK